jgi:membrane protease YdiL (CAAX protease family)
VQLAVAYALLEVALWTQGERQHVASLMFISWIAVTTLLQRRPARELGLGLSGLRGALVAIPLAVLAAGVILLAGWLLGTLRPLYGTRPPLWHSLGYATWAMVQQFILNSYFYLTLERLPRSPRRAMWGAVLLFTLAHIPNPVLLAGTFLGAIFFVSVFRRYRNIYPLGLAHAMLGLSLAATVPDVYMHHMRVGISYFRFVLIH